ncbi:MAG: L-threonylcarbamoyladenylate synthase [Thermoplasmatota archaeon]
MTVVKWDASDADIVLERIEEEFSKDLPVIIPTDTIYGLAAPVGNIRCLEAIYELKQRPPEMTLPVAVGNLPMVDDIAVIKRWQKDPIRRGLPGALTIILEVKADLPALVVRDGTIAVRVPRHPIFIPLTSRVGPVGLTSANRHGDGNILNAEEIDRQFEGNLLVVEDDKALSGRASAIIDLTNETASILREGNLNMDELMGGEHGGR